MLWRVLGLWLVCGAINVLSPTIRWKGFEPAVVGVLEALLLGPLLTFKFAARRIGGWPTLLLALVAVSFVIRGTVFHQGEVTDEKWRRASLAVGAGQNIQEIINILGQPDAVGAPQNGRGSTCYMWGKHGVAVNSRDYAVGTCFWQRVR